MISETGRPFTKEIIIVDGNVKVKPKPRHKDKKYVCSKCLKAFARDFELNRHYNRVTPYIKSEEDVKKSLFERYDKIYEIFINEYKLFLALPYEYKLRERQTMVNYIEMVEHEIKKIKIFIDNDKYNQGLNELEFYKKHLENI